MNNFKKKSMSRNEFVAKKIKLLNGEKVLDLGCRDAILEKFLEGNFEYTGIDFIPKNDNNIKIINLNLENPLPINIGKFDIITAIDVLEHLENIHDRFIELFNLSNNKVIIALPNMSYYKFRLNFFFKGQLSEKYKFSSKKTKDRHRWLPIYFQIEKFIKENTPLNWKIKKYDFIAHRTNGHIIYNIEKILSKFFPSFFVYELIYIFTKRD